MIAPVPHGGRGPRSMATTLRRRAAPPRRPRRRGLRRGRGPLDRRPGGAAPARGAGRHALGRAVRREQEGETATPPTARAPTRCSARPPHRPERQLDLEVAGPRRCPRRRRQGGHGQRRRLRRRLAAPGTTRPAPPTTYRIPVARWEETLAALRAVGAKVSRSRPAPGGSQPGRRTSAPALPTSGDRGALQAIMARRRRSPTSLESRATERGAPGDRAADAQKQSLEEQAAMATLTSVLAPAGLAVAQVREGWDPERRSTAPRPPSSASARGSTAPPSGWRRPPALALVVGAILAVAWLVVRRVRPRTEPPAPLDAPAA